MKPFISIVIPFCDGDSGLNDTIESIKAQTFQNVEIIVVNNDSSDKKVLDSLNGLEKSDVFKLKIIKQSQGGAPCSINCGTKFADGKYILPLVSGDVMEPTMLEKGYCLLEANSKIGFVYLDNNDLDDNNKELTPLNGFSYANIFEKKFHVSTGLFSRKIWENVGGFNEGIETEYMFWDFCLSLAEKGRYSVKIRENLLFHRGQRDAKQKRLRRREWQVKIILMRKYLGTCLRIFFKKAVKKTQEFIYAVYLNKIKKLLPRKMLVFAFKTRDKILAAGILDMQLWIHHPLDAIVRSIPMRLKGKINKFLGRAVFNLKWPIADKQNFGANVIDADMGVPNKYSIKAENNKINILVLHPSLFVGGSEKVLYELFSHSDEKKFSFHLITDIPTNNPWHHDFSKVIKNIFHMPNFLPGEAYVEFIMNYIDSRRIDLVLISGSWLGYDCTPIIKSRFPNVKIVDILHIEEPKMKMDNFRYSMKYKQYLDKRIVITEYLKQALIEKYEEAGDRIEALLNGVDVAGEFNPDNYEYGKLYNDLNLDKNLKLVTFVGRYVDQKQPEHFLKIAERFKKDKRLLFLMFGEGDLKESILDYKVKHDLQNVRIFKSTSQFPKVIKDSFAVVYPSKREGLPMVGISSLAMGSLVIASDVPGWRELIRNGENGILVQDGNIDEYQKALIEILDNDELRTRLQQNARKDAMEIYDIKVICEKYERLFLELIK